LESWAERDDEALDAYERLMVLATESGEWPIVIQNARRYLAVDPLGPLTYRFLARAAEAADQADEALGAYRALLRLDPRNPAEIHLQLAKLLHRQGDPAARRHVLQALEEAPRYREALQLLLHMKEQETRAEAGREHARPTS
jgi:cytochrome c-type biogenesis protein CcmH/NrfG